MTLREELGDELCEYCDYNDGTCEGSCDGCDDAYENYKEQKRTELMSEQNTQKNTAKIHVDIDTEDIETEIVCAFTRNIDRAVQSTIDRIVAEGILPLPSWRKRSRLLLIRLCVSMLMNNETYQRLSGSMQNLIGNSK